MQVELTAPRTTEGPPPDRRPCSLRRTTSFQTHWPDGIAQPMIMTGRARDLFTGSDPATPSIVASENIEAVLTIRRRIERIAASRRQESMDALVGLYPGGVLRKAMAQLIPDEIESATLLHRLLDDMGGASFIAPTGWVAWTPDWRDRYRTVLGDDNHFDIPMTGTCAGFSAGASSLLEDGTTNFDAQSRVVMQPPLREDDPYAWHELDRREGPHSWRIRRTDIWIEDNRIQADIGFQDSGARPDGQRMVVHEYRLAATIDLESSELLSVHVTPAILPYGSCRMAAPNTDRLVGKSLLTFGRAAPAVLAHEVGCTHLNDVLRTLQDIPVLATTLRELGVEKPIS